MDGCRKWATEKRRISTPQPRLLLFYFCFVQCQMPCFLSPLHPRSWREPRGAGKGGKIRRRIFSSVESVSLDKSNSFPPPTRSFAFVRIIVLHTKMHWMVRNKLQFSASSSSSFTKTFTSSECFSFLLWAEMSENRSCSRWWHGLGWDCGCSSNAIN